MALIKSIKRSIWLGIQQILRFASLTLLYSALTYADNTSYEPKKHLVLPVVNAQNKQTSISRNGLSAIFKMRLSQWSDGTPVTVYVLPDDDPLHKKFSKKILKVFPHQLRRIWNNAVFSGSGQAPITLSSLEEMKEKIATTPGAIGSLTQDSLNDSIKILQVQ